MSKLGAVVTPNSSSLSLFSGFLAFCVCNRSNYKYLDKINMIWVYQCLEPYLKCLSYFDFLAVEVLVSHKMNLYKKSSIRH